MLSNAVIALSLMFSICYLSSCSKGAAVDKIIEKEVEAANKSCPVAMDSETRLDSVTHPAKSTIGYYYTLINLEKDSLTFGPEMLENNLVEAIIATPQVKILRELDTIFKYVYFDKNGDVAFEINVTPEKYK